MATRRTVDARIRSGAGLATVSGGLTLVVALAFAGTGEGGPDRLAHVSFTPKPRAAVAAIAPAPSTTLLKTTSGQADEAQAARPAAPKAQQSTPPQEQPAPTPVSAQNDDPPPEGFILYGVTPVDSDKPARD